MPIRDSIRKTLIPALLVLLMLTVGLVSVTNGDTTSSLSFADRTTQALAAGSADPSPASTVPTNKARWVVRAFFDGRQMVDNLATWREPWEIHYDKGYLVLDVSPEEYGRLIEAGFRLEIDEQSTARLNQRATALPGQVTGIPGFPCYRTVEETYSTAEALAANYPGLATWTDIGDSWEKTEPGGLPGYDMMVLRLTNSSIPGPKPKLLIVSSIHAREYTPAELVTRFAEHLVGAYGSDADVTWLLDYHEIHMVLQANPDGRKHAEAGMLWRKNTNNNHCADTSLRGVDLNRNFEFQWGCCGGSSGLECSELYRGPTAASEPETQALQNYVHAEFPDQREDGLGAAAPITATGVVLDIHSFSELVLWPWGFASTPAPNSAGLQTLGRKLAFFNQYRPQVAFELYKAEGTTDEFAYGELGLAAFSFEVGTTFFQECTEFENTILPDNLPALIYAAKAAREPYLTPAGPDVSVLSVTPAAIIPGAPVRLTATIDDTRYNNQNGTEPVQDVFAAEYYIDFPPWFPSTASIAHPMTAVDGAFDQVVEEVKAIIDSSDLKVGRHIVFVRGQDAEGNWGAFSAIFLDTTLSAAPPVYLPLFVDQD